MHVRRREQRAGFSNCTLRLACVGCRRWSWARYEAQVSHATPGVSKETKLIYDCDNLVPFDRKLGIIHEATFIRASLVTRERDASSCLCFGPEWASRIGPVSARFSTRKLGMGRVAVGAGSSRTGSNLFTSAFLQEG